MAVRFVSGLVGSDDQAEDLFQEAARAIYERDQSGGVRFESIPHARNYLFRTLRNLAVDCMSGKARRTNPLGDHAEKVQSSEPDPLELLTNSEQKMAQGLREERLARAVRALGRKEREVLHLRFVEGWTFREIEEETGTSISTLHSRVSAAFTKIRRKVGKDPVGQ